MRTWTFTTNGTFRTEGSIAGMSFRKGGRIEAEFVRCADLNGTNVVYLRLETGSQGWVPILSLSTNDLEYVAAFKNEPEQTIHERPRTQLLISDEEAKQGDALDKIMERAQRRIQSCDDTYQRAESLSPEARHAARRRALEDKLAVQKEALAEVDELKTQLEAKMKLEQASGGPQTAERPESPEHTPANNAAVDALDEIIASMEANRASLLKRHYDDAELAADAVRIAEDAENSIRALKAQRSMIKALDRTPSADREAPK
jgi:hypothetical protein